jgi:NAD(P)-dependent dehydrogenase (short-subunit alcohol dehydrogenase family)
VAVDAPDLAARLVAEGATVVVVGSGGDDTGRLLAELEGGPGRAAFFSGASGFSGSPGAATDALVEFIAEQFGGSLGS